jgi:arabinogalactan endo-1,4-beta-galactosidase
MRQNQTTNCLQPISWFYGLFLVISLFSCAGKAKTDPTPTQPVNPIPAAPDTFIRAADMSFVPEIEASGIAFLNNNVEEDPIRTFKAAGGNFIRLRLWHSPTTGHSDLEEVKQFSERIHALGLKVWLTVHFSDSWADPGKQAKPEKWKGLSVSLLKDSVSLYMARVTHQVRPDLIQIGNETNDGLLWPEGKLSTQPAQSLELFATAITAVRNTSPTTKVMLHYAGISGADWFFSRTKNLNYDYIGISYYPIWHGKNLDNLSNTLKTLKSTYNKKVLIAETSYPFTLGWNDWTNNVVGLEDHLLTGVPATQEGQLQFLVNLKNLVKSSGGAGFCYWGGEWIAFKGAEAQNGSTWENQALWGFNRNALPALAAFAK